MKTIDATLVIETLADTLVIETQTELENALCRYNCLTVEDLDNLLWYTYGINLIIKLNNHEE